MVCGLANTTRWCFTSTDGAPLTIARCARCGHVYQCPRLSQSWGRERFRKGYAGELVDKGYFDPALKEEHARLLWQSMGRQVSNVRRLLDVGAGMGSFVHVARQAGVDAVGTELSETGVRRARELYGLDLFCGPLAELPTTEPFDLVTLWDVIEHCLRPDRMLLESAERLRDGGVLMLSTGNYESVDRLALGSRWYLWLADHYHFFSPSGMRRLAERLGLADFRYAGEVRLPGGWERNKPRPSPLRFLNPAYDARLALMAAKCLGAVLRWPRHWNIAIMTCTMRRPGGWKPPQLPSDQADCGL